MARQQGELFEEAAVEQVRVAGLPLVLQAEEQVPEVDAGDALAGELPGRSCARAPCGRRAGFRTLGTRGEGLREAGERAQM